MMSSSSHLTAAELSSCNWISPPSNFLLGHDWIMCLIYRRILIVESWLFAILLSAIIISSSFFAFRLLKKMFVTDLFGLSVRCHFQKYFWILPRSSLSVSSNSVKLLTWTINATSSAYINFLEDVSVISVIYVLNSKEENIDSFGSPFLRLL